MVELLTGLTLKAVFWCSALLPTLSAVLIYIHVNSVPRKVGVARYAQNTIFRVRSVLKQHNEAYDFKNLVDVWG